MRTKRIHINKSKENSCYYVSCNGVTVMRVLWTYPGYTVLFYIGPSSTCEHYTIDHSISHDELESILQKKFDEKIMQFIDM